MISRKFPYGLLIACCLVFVAYCTGGCDDPNSGNSIFVPKPPKFVFVELNSSHGFFQANWYVTIHNQGGSGAQTVQWWIGSETSRKVIYSERHTLSSGEKKTIHISDTHFLIGSLLDAAVYGLDQGATFLP